MQANLSFYKSYMHAYFSNFLEKIESSQIGHSCKLCHFSKRHQHPLHSFKSTILKKIRLTLPNSTNDSTSCGKQIFGSNTNSGQIAARVWYNLNIEKGPRACLESYHG